MTETMKEAIREQTQKLRIASIRMNAEKEVLRQLLPEQVQKDLHYNGKTRAIERNPSFAEAIEILSS